MRLIASLRDKYKILENKMSYLVLARKYRPQNFLDIIGQEHVSKTFMNALKSGHISHAYLFSGPRGVGKTTAARILAKTVNCLEEDLDKRPCFDCDICNDSRTMDIIEIDGASNRGIDEIRDLRENVKFAPVNSKYKVYIIDEVHMLTDQAFNALLKTLEEPPSHVIFIFATTELHKIPETILSRCQKFNFRLISLDDIINRLKFILDKENIKYETPALSSIARASLGSMRDSLSLLDQVISYSPDFVSEKETDFILGIINVGTIFEIVNNILANKTKDLMLVISDILKEGYDLNQLMLQLREHCRILMLLKIDTKLAEILNIIPEEIELYHNQAKAFSLGKLTRDIRLINLAIEEIKRTDYPRIICELYFTKLSQPYLSPVELFEKLEKIGDVANLEISEINETEIVKTNPAKMKDVPRVLEEKKISYNANNTEKNIVETTNLGVSNMPVSDMAAKIENTVTENLPTDEKKSTNTENSPDLDELKSKWNVVLEKVKKKKMYVFSYLETVKEFDLKGSKLMLFFASKFQKDGVHKNKELIEEVLEEVFGRKIVVGCEFKMFFDSKQDDIIEQKNDEKIELPPAPADEDIEEIPTPKDEDNSNIVEDNKLRYTPDEIIEKEPIVKDLLDIFDGDLLPPDK